MKKDFNDIFETEEIENIKVSEIPEMINNFYQGILETNAVESLYFTILENDLSDKYATAYKDIRQTLKAEGVNID